MINPTQQNNQNNKSDMSDSEFKIMLDAMINQKFEKRSKDCTEQERKPKADKGV